MRSHGGQAQGPPPNSGQSQNFSSMQPQSATSVQMMQQGIQPISSTSSSSTSGNNSSTISMQNMYLPQSTNLGVGNMMSTQQQSSPAGVTLFPSMGTPYGETSRQPERISSSNIVMGGSMNNQMQQLSQTNYTAGNFDKVMLNPQVAPGQFGVQQQQIALNPQLPSNSQISSGGTGIPITMISEQSRISPLPSGQQFVSRASQPQPQFIAQQHQQFVPQASQQQFMAQSPSQQQHFMQQASQQQQFATQVPQQQQFISQASQQQQFVSQAPQQQQFMPQAQQQQPFFQQAPQQQQSFVPQTQQQQQFLSQAPSSQHFIAGSVPQSMFQPISFAASGVAPAGNSSYWAISPQSVGAQIAGYPQLNPSLSVGSYLPINPIQMHQQPVTALSTPVIASSSSDDKIRAAISASQQRKRREDGSSLPTPPRKRTASSDDVPSTSFRAQDVLGFRSSAGGEGGGAAGATSQDRGVARRRKGRKMQNTSSEYRGVSWNKRDKRWMARIWIDRKLKSLGNFTCEKRAALAVDDTLLEIFGEDDPHIILNFKTKEERERVRRELDPQ